MEVLKNKEKVEILAIVMLLIASGIEKWSNEISSCPQLKLICQLVQKVVLHI